MIPRRSFRLREDERKRLKLQEILQKTVVFNKSGGCTFTETTKNAVKICSVFFELSQLIFIDFMRKFHYNLK